MKTMVLVLIGIMSCSVLAAQAPGAKEKNRRTVLPGKPKQQYDKDGNLLPPAPPPPKIEVVKFQAPKGVKDVKIRYDKDGKRLPPPPPPPRPVSY